MAILPASIIYGVVTGRLVLASPDTGDEGDLPEPVALTGRVTFTPTVKAVTDLGSGPGSGTTIPLQIETAELIDGLFAIKLVATNYGQPQGWTWKVSFELISTPGVTLAPFYILVPGNVITDLAHAAPIQESSGVHILQAVGMPRGGSTGQYIVKLSNADYHFGFVTGGGGGGGSGPVLVESLEDASDVGKTFLLAADAAAARTVIGAGTSSLALGTTASTARAGDWKPAAADITDSGTAGRSVITAATGAEIRASIGATTVDELGQAQTPGKNLLKAATQTDARAAIGAGTGTSSLALGTTASTAKAGNWFPAWNEVTSKPTFHNVATSGDYTQLNNLPTEVIAHTHDDLIARIEAVEARPMIFYVENESSAIPAEARPQDYIVYRSSSAAPAITAYRTWKGAGVAADTVLGTGVTGTADNAFDATAGTATVRVNGNGLREIEVPSAASAVTFRWSSTTGTAAMAALQDFSFDFGWRPTVVTTASSTFLQLTGVLKLSMTNTNTISLLSNTDVYQTASAALTLGSGIYRIKGWRQGSTAGALTYIKIYAPDGSVFWEPTGRDVGVATATAMIMGRTGTAGGAAFWSNIRLHNVGAELTN